MRDLEVFIPCDAPRCGTRSMEIWTKTFDGNVWPLTFCGHHSDQMCIPLQRAGFNPLESEALTK